MEELIQQIIAKLEQEGQNPKTHFEGMLHSKPMNYWDYIQTDALLNLQTQRTNLPDELIFIMYHQINELLFKPDNIMSPWGRAWGPGLQAPPTCASARPPRRI